MVSRRVILAILAVFVLAIAAACSSDGDSSTTATSGSTGTTQEQQQPAAAEAAQGVTGSTSSAAVAAAAAAPTGSGSAPAAVIPKVTRVVLGSTAGALESNIARDTGSPDSWQKRPMYEWLIGMDAKTGQPIPMLATSWTVEGDGSVIRFQLREGVRFHDGGEFTADDVIHSADVRFDPAGARSLLAEAGYGPGNPAEIKLIVLAVSQYSGAEDIIESVFSMFQDVGIKSELVTMDVATRRAKDRAMELENHLSLTATASNQFVGWRVYNHSRPPRFGYEDAFTDGLYNALSVEIDTVKRGIQFQELGEYSFNNHTSIPLFWLPGEVIINPKFVSEWVFPGSITGFWTHVENIRAAQ